MISHWRAWFRENPDYLALVLAAYGFLLFRALTAPVYQGDTQALMTGVTPALNCLRAGRFTECDDIAHFPLFQQALAILGAALGASVQLVVHGLVVLSALSLAGVFLLLGFGDSRRKWLALATMLSSPLLWYATTTFGELAAAFLVTLIPFGVIHRGHWATLAMATFLAGLTKEVAAPFLMTLGLGAVCLVETTRQARLKRLLPITSGAALATLCNVAFNEFRYGDLVNVTLLNPGLQVHDPVQQANFLVQLLIAPNGGVLVFWPVVGLTVLAGATAALRTFFKRTSLRALFAEGRFIAQLCGGLTFAGLLLGFSRWYAPFGWAAWGPRLLLPWLPALFLLMVSSGVWPVVTGRRAVAFATLVGALSLPQLLVAVDPEMISGWFQGPLCLGPIDAARHPAEFYACANRGAWSLSWSMFEWVFRTASSPALGAGLGFSIVSGYSTWKALQPPLLAGH